MARAAGIEVLKNRVKLLVLETGGKKPKIVGFVEQPIVVAPDEEWTIPAVEAVREALQTAKAQRVRMISAIDSGEAILRELALPFTEMDQLRSVVPHEIESVIHNYAIEDLVVDFFQTEKSERGSHVVAAAVPKKAVRAHLDLLRDAHLDPGGVDLDVAALFNSLDHADAVQSGEPFLIVYGTSRFAKLVFVENGKPRSIRTIRFSLPEAKEGRSEEDEFAASREWKTEEVPGPVPIVLLSSSDVAKFSELDFETRSSLMEILAKEISRFMLANAASATPTHMLVCGEFEDEESAALLEGATGIPTRRVSLLDSVEHYFHSDEHDVESRIAVPLGLALKGVGVDALRMDFRKEEFVYKKKYEGVKTTALVTVELIIVFLAALSLYFYFQASDLSDLYLAKIYDEQSLYYETLFNTKPSAPQKTYDEMMLRKRRLQEEIGETSDHPLPHSALQIWGKLYRQLQNFQQLNRARKLGDEDLWVEIDQLQISHNTTPGRESLTVSLRFTTRNHAYADALLQEVRKEKDGLFANAAWKGSTVPVPEKGIRFNLESVKEKNE